MNRLPSVPVVRVQLIKESTQTLPKGAICIPEIAADLFRQFLDGADREYFLMLALDTKNKPIGLNVVSIGTIDAALIHPREVFKPAILMNAACIMVAHNHPSGDPTPSRDDKVVTERLAEAGALLGIDLLDHIVIGDTHVSMRERGYIPEIAAKPDHLS